MAENNFNLEIRENRIAIIHINKVKTKNALNANDWAEFQQVLTEAENSHDADVIILVSDVAGAFISGADIKEFMNANFEDALYSVSNEVCRQIGRCKKPVVAVIDGMAFGGGCEVALASDFRIITDQAVFGLPETGLGVLPAMGGTQRLVRMVGIAKAKEVILLGNILKADDIESCGLSTVRTTSEKTEEAVVKLAGKLQKRGARAFSVAKRCIDAALSTDVDTGMFMENIAFCALMSGREMQEGTEAFVERRAPKFYEMGW